MSGRLDATVADEFKQLGLHAVLEKPFAPGQLEEALTKVF